MENNVSPAGRFYVERFNHRDWDGLRELIVADAQLRVADAFAGPLADSPYFSNYARLSIPWKLALGQLDGETVVIVLRRGADRWTPYTFVRLHVAGQQIVGEPILRRRIAEGAR